METRTKFPAFGEELPRPLTYEELVLLVLDASGSMGENETESGRSKAEQVLRHLLDDQNGLVQRLKLSSNRTAWHLAVVTFDNHTDVRQPVPIVQIEPRDLQIDLLGRHGNTTAIGSALETAFQVAQDWLAMADPLVPRYVTILLMTDGGENCGSDPLGVAERIKTFGQPGDIRQPILIAAAAYGDQADLALLQRIASQRPDGSSMVARVSNGMALRDFFMRSLSSSTPGGKI